jgi:hypothetical protein
MNQFVPDWNTTSMGDGFAPLGFVRFLDRSWRSFHGLEAIR